MEKLFTISVSSNSNQRVRLNPADELPLYAECVEAALNDSQLAGCAEASQSCVEYVKLNIEWRSFEDISK